MNASSPGTWQMASTGLEPVLTMASMAEMIPKKRPATTQLRRGMRRIMISPLVTFYVTYLMVAM